MAIIEKREKSPNIEIDLGGPQGNAWFLLGLASNYGKQLGLDCEAIREEMKSGDYENLIQVFDKHFGDIVTLVRP